jgi:hypothetical protein
MPIVHQTVEVFPQANVSQAIVLPNGLLIVQAIEQRIHAVGCG